MPAVTADLILSQTDGGRAALIWAGPLNEKRALGSCSGAGCLLKKSAGSVDGAVSEKKFAGRVAGADVAEKKSAGKVSGACGVAIIVRAFPSPTGFRRMCK